MARDRRTPGRSHHVLAQVPGGSGPEALDHLAPGRASALELGEKDRDTVVDRHDVGGRVHIANQCVDTILC